MRLERLIVLLTGETNEPVEAYFVEEVTPKEIRATEALWQPFQLGLLRQSLIQGQSAGDLPQHAHWDWNAKIREATTETRFFGVRWNDEFQGLMALKPGRSIATSSLGQPLMYVDYLAAAPWNNAAQLERFRMRVRFRRVGRTMIENAIRLSKDEGNNGRIGLHSLPQAESFYGSTLGMVDFGRDLTYYGLRYFEHVP